MGSACSEITEYSSTVAAGMNMYDSETMSWAGSFPAPVSAKAIFIMDNSIYFTCSDGYIRSYHTVEQVMLEEAMIGQPSSTGYSLMAYNPLRESLYVNGSTGNILEISIPDCQVTGEFAVCASPVLMEVTSGTPGYLWVVDGVENSISQVHLETSGYCGSLSYPEISQIRDIAASVYNDSLLIGTSKGFFCLSSSHPGVFRSAYIVGFDKACASLISIPGDSNFVAVLDWNGMKIGEMWAYTDSTFLFPPPRFYNSETVDGNLFITASGTDSSAVYLLAGGCDYGTVLSIYTTGEDYGIHQSVEVPGEPLDVKEYNGVIYALTYE